MRKYFSYTLLWSALALSITACVSLQPPEAVQPCTDVEGYQSLQKSLSQEVSYLLLGEVHGTNEGPETASKIACALSDKRPVVIALERSPSFQSSLDDYLSSDGGDSARETLIRNYFDGTEWGQSSQAIYNLIVSAKEMRDHNRRISIRTFAKADLVPDTAGQEVLERQYADELVKIHTEHPSAIIIALTGNVHARLKTYDSHGIWPVFSTMGSFLPQENTLSFNMMLGGGAAYNCTVQDGCGPHEIPNFEIPFEGFSLSDDDKNFSGNWYVKRVTPAYPIGGKVDPH